MGFTTCSRPEQQCVSQVLFDANLAELPEKADAADARGKPRVVFGSVGHEKWWVYWDFLVGDLNRFDGTSMQFG